MDIFYTGILVLTFMTALFYVVMGGFIYYWHLKKITVVVVPAIFAFEYFVRGFITIGIICIILKYLPDLIIRYGF